MATRKLMGVLAGAAMVYALAGSCRTPGLPAQPHFPLTGAHRAASCASCHPADLATAVPTSCTGCHLPDRPTPHFDGECEACHNTTSWQDAVFDHGALPAGTPCISCHLADRPTPHAEGDCGACHGTTTWEDAVFDHGSLPVGTTCISCHLADRPTPHAEGDCGSCHGTTTWEDATFDHGSLPGGTTCTSCHAGDRPAGHFDGDCVECHNTTSWEDATFDHSPYFPLPHRGVQDCAECHPAPAGTTAFTCLNCHEHRRSETDDEHRGQSGYSYESTRCIACHPRGR